MKSGEKISVKILQDLINYNPFTGEFSWLERSSEMFEDTLKRTAQVTCNNWNARYAGKPCFTQKHPFGYKIGTIWNVKYLAHRVAWALSYGSWPQELIDHVNQNPCDNRLVNLREATKSQNAHNSKKPVTNTSGFKGVSLCRQTGKWRAVIKNNNSAIWLGRWGTPELAYKAYCTAATTFHKDFRSVSE